MDKKEEIKCLDNLINSVSTQEGLDLAYFHIHYLEKKGYDVRNQREDLELIEILISNPQIFGGKNDTKY